MRQIRLVGSCVGFCALAAAGACDGDGIGRPCGGVLGLTCPEGEFCDFAAGGCGAGDQAGFCRTPPEVCTLIFAPVCGCDGRTYGNECEAAAAGVSVASQGECQDGGTVCGGLLGTPCAEGEFCRFQVGSCGADDQTGVCQAFPEACPEIFAPVCGCDDQTYSNECEAATAGVSVAGAGECPG